MQITSNEREVLVNGIFNSDFYQESGENWVDCVEDYCSLSGKTLSGVMSSLAKKGLIKTDGEGVIITEEGLKFCKEGE